MRRLSSILALIVLLTTTGAWAQAPPPTSPGGLAQMERPVWQVGDRWVYVGRNSHYGSAHEVDTITGTTDFQGKAAYVMQVEIEWTDIRGNKSLHRHTTVWDMNFGVIERRDDHGQVTERWSGNTGMQWPLAVGRKWTIEGTEEYQARGGWVKSRITGSASVTGLEDVTTPAGTFKAFHVQYGVRWLDSRGREVWRLDEDIWWSPEVRAPVKYSDRDSMNTEEEELAEPPAGP